MQAIHDFLYNHIHLKSYDHFEFPGVVPRTCIGSLFLAMVTFPLSTILLTLDPPIIPPKLSYQLVSRFVLGACSWIALCIFSQAAAKRFHSNRLGRLILLLSGLLFHIPFYASRTLPNTFAFIGVTIALSKWLQGNAKVALGIITATMTIFRCDLLVLLAPLTLQMLLFREVQILEVIVVGLMCGIPALASTFLIDSLFWQKLVWPEGVVLFFNTVQNKSSEWGVMPWHWYFTNALLKSFHLMLPLSLLGILGLGQWRKESSKNVTIKAALVGMLSPRLNTQLLRYISPCFAFISLYSILPHKELRFILPALPLLLLPPSVALDNMLPSHKHKANGIDETDHTEQRRDSLSNLLYWLLEDDEESDQVDGKKDQGQDEVIDKTDNSGDSNKSNSDNSANNVVKRKNSRKNNESETKAESTVKSVTDKQIPYSIQLMDSFMRICVVTFFLLVAIISSTFTLASYHNYPGGHALRHLLYDHIPRVVLESDTPRHNMSIHIDVSAAMTGVTRFGQENGKTIVTWLEKTGRLAPPPDPRKQTSPPASDRKEGDEGKASETKQDENTKFADKSASSSASASESDIVSFSEPVVLDLVYSKEEDLTSFSQFDWLLTADPINHNKNAEFDIVEVVKTFKRIKLNPLKSILPSFHAPWWPEKLLIEAEVEDGIYIMKRKSHQI